MPEGTKYQSILSVPVLWSLTTSVGSQQFPKGAEWIWNLYLTSFLRVKSYSYPAEQSLQCILLKLYLTLQVSVQGSLASSKKKKKGELQTAWVWWQKQCDLLLSSIYLFLSRTFKHSLDTINTHICSPLPCYSQLLIILNQIWPLLWTQAKVNSNLMSVTLTEAWLLLYMHLCQGRKLSECCLTSIERTKLH